MDLFQQTKPRYSLPNRPKLFESFAGVGMQRMGFDRLGLEYEMVGISEIDKHAIQSYMAIHGETPNYGDITKIKGEDLPQIDVFTYSFPCQDLSVAGKGKGMKEGTRSGLVYEVIRILRELKEFDRLPGVLIMENVTAILNKKHIDGFEKIKSEIEELGYTNYVDKLNAKNYGVAQSRDRAWMISVLGDYYYEFPKPIPLEKRLKDYLESEVDEKYYLSMSGIERMLTTNFDSSKFKNRVSEVEDVIGTLCARDYKDPKCVIEPSLTVTPINENYSLLSGGKWDKMHDISRRVYNTESTAPTVHTMGGGNTELKIIEPKINVVAKLNQKHEQSARIHGTDGISPTVMSNSHGKTDGGYTPIKIIEPICLNSKVDGKQPSLQDRIYDSDGISTAITTGWMPNITEPSVIVKEATKQGYDIAHVGDSINLEQPNSNTRRGRVGKGVAQTLTTSPQQAVVEPIPFEQRKDEGLRFFSENIIDTLRTIDSGGDKRVIEESLRIRKLTPLECWRLMGIDDEDFHKAKASGVSKSQLYKQAGNGLVVDVFAALISTMINTQEVSIEMEVKMTVKELIEILTWCDDDKPVRISMGNKQIEIDNANEEDDCIVLVAS